MASIGGQTVDTLTGEVLQLRNRYQDIGRAGVGGEGFREMAVKSPQSQINTSKALEDADFAALKLAYEAFRGTLQTITKDDGLEYENVFIIDVQTVRREIANSTVALADVLAEATWTVKDSNVTSGS